MEGIVVATALVLAVLSLAEALHSLTQGAQLVRGFRSARRSSPGGPSPEVTLVVPCRGRDPGLARNLAAFCALDYPALRIAFVTSDRGDPSVATILEVLTAHPATRAEVLFAGHAQGRGQKVHNLLHAVSQLDANTEILAFGDSDIRPGPAWLRDLVAPLRDQTVGASTGFRWYVPPSRRFASALRSVWNAGILGLMGGDEAPFAWGGAMALRRNAFDELDVNRVWEGTLSDDYALSRALRERGLRIRFEPRCLSFTYEDCSWQDLWRWSFRQLLITRVYHPRLWRLGLASELLNNVAFWGGLATVVTLVAIGPWTVSLWMLAGVLGGIYAIRCVKAGMRFDAVRALFAEETQSLATRRWYYVCLGPLTSLVTLTGLIRSAFTSRLEWRGIRYRLVSATETVVEKTQ